MISPDDPTQNDNGEEDFATLFEQSQRETKSTRFEVGQTVSGRVLQIGAEWTFLDIGAKGEATIATAELTDEDGKATVAVGGTLEARVVRLGEDGIVLSRVLQKGREARERLEQAHDLGLPVEGVVTAEIKGGLEVEVAGVRAFCPASQIDLRYVEDLSTYIGQRYPFRITQYGERGRNIVVSRKVLLAEERAEQAAQTREQLREGSVFSGNVTSLREYGAFVDIGGVEGLLHISEIAYGRVQRAADVLEVGQTVEVQVVKLEGDKISLSMKSLATDPWEDGTRFAEGSRHKGTVVRVQPFGAFVELLPGVDGLLHVSNFGDPRIKDARRAVQEGDQLDVVVIAYEPARRRIGLSLAEVAQRAAVSVSPGAVVTGEVDRVESYGVFVRFPGEGGSYQRGLVPLSELGDFRGDLRKAFPVASTVEVVVLDPDEKGRMRLSVRAAAQVREREHASKFLTDQSGKGGLGTLGDLLRPKGDSKRKR